MDQMRSIMSQKEVSIMNISRKKIYRILITFIVMKHLEMEFSHIFICIYFIEYHCHIYLSNLIPNTLQLQEDCVPLKYPCYYQGIQYSNFVHSTRFQQQVISIEPRKWKKWS